MSLLGKILLFLNLLAAVLFFYVAGLDWSMRYQWVEAGIQQRLLIDGLPLDDNQKDPDGNPLAKDIREGTLKKLLTGGPVVHTQVEELKRVKDELQKQIDQGEGTKAQRLATVLAHLATNINERKKYLQDGQDEKKTDELQAKFDGWFNDVMAGGAGDAAKHAPGDRQAEAAHLLFCSADLLRLQEEDKPSLLKSRAYQRCLATTGVKACADEMERETKALGQMAQDVRSDIDRDRETFLGAAQALLAQINDLAAKCERQKSVLKFQRELVDKQRTLAETRMAEVDALEKQLAAAREATQEQLKVQARMEDQLFKSRREERDNLDKNLQLERQLRSLEKGR